jgi:hypothetical protein
MSLVQTQQGRSLLHPRLPQDEMSDPLRDFKALICKPLDRPLAKALAPRRNTKIPATPNGLPRHSARASTMSRMLDEEALAIYNDLYHSPLGSTQRRTIHVLFTVGGAPRRSWPSWIPKGYCSPQGSKKLLWIVQPFCVGMSVDSVPGRVVT